jgi:tRNA threonylcarbamoyladenosine biosynthesis protein TsaE
VSGWPLEARTASAAQTRELAEALAATVGPGDVVLLIGGLGSGKTTFAQGFARGLGVEGPVTSPTFTLVREYPCHGTAGLRRLLHADVYRLESMGEVIDLALPELVEDDAVAVVEWGDVAAPALGAEVLKVTLRPGDGDDERVVELAGEGEGWSARRAELAEKVGRFPVQAGRHGVADATGLA